MSLERVQSRTERSADRREVADQPHYGPWLDTAAAAEYLSFRGKHPRRSVYKFMARHRIVARHDGKRLLIHRADLERALANLAHGVRQDAGSPSQSNRNSLAMENR